MLYKHACNDGDGKEFSIDGGGSSAPYVGIKGGNVFNLSSSSRSSNNNDIKPSEPIKRQGVIRDEKLG